MKITLDISLYPLTEEFIPIIKAFIAKMDTYEGVSVAKNNISTQISGEYDTIMSLLHTELKSVFESQRSVFVIKFLAGDKVND